MQTRKRSIPDNYESVFNYETFKERLENLITTNSTTQKELANYLDIEPLAITRWKSGKKKNPINYKYIVKMARYFNVDEEYLYDPQYESPNMIREYYSKLEEDFYETDKEFIHYMFSLGYDVIFSNRIDIIGKNGHIINSFEKQEWENFKTKIKLLVEYTLLS